MAFYRFLLRDPAGPITPEEKAIFTSESGVAGTFKRAGAQGDDATVVLEWCRANRDLFLPSDRKRPEHFIQITAPTRVVRSLEKPKSGRGMPHVTVFVLEKPPEGMPRWRTILFTFSRGKIHADMVHIGYEGPSLLDEVSQE
jgi:hypothetical protein